jgi:hypothetical protein
MKPWTKVEQNKNYYEIHCDGAVIAHVANCDEAVAGANASLIASAPELLAALKEVAECCEYRLRKGEDSGDRQTLHLCRAAIDKAEKATLS